VIKGQALGFNITNTLQSNKMVNRREREWRVTYLAHILYLRTQNFLCGPVGKHYHITTAWGMNLFREVNINKEKIGNLGSS